jgi:hypothetical protein
VPSCSLFVASARPCTAPSAHVYHPDGVVRTAQPAEAHGCFCQSTKYPFDNRKTTHLSGLGWTLTGVPFGATALAELDADALYEQEGLGEVLLPPQSPTQEAQPAHRLGDARTE